MFFPKGYKKQLAYLGTHSGCDADKTTKTGMAPVFGENHTYISVNHGCVSPMGLLNDESKSVTAVFDSTLDESAIVGVHPNDTTASIWMAFRDVVRIVREHGSEIVILEFSESTQ